MSEQIPEHIKDSVVERILGRKDRDTLRRLMDRVCSTYLDFVGCGDGVNVDAVKEHAKANLMLENFVVQHWADSPRVDLGGNNDVL